MHLRQRFVAVGLGVDVGVEAVLIVFLQEVAAVPQAAQVGEEWEGDGRYGRRSRRGRPAEIREGKDDSEVATFTGDFIEGHGGFCDEILIDKNAYVLSVRTVHLNRHVIQATAC